MSDTAFPATVSIVAYWAAGLPLGWFLATAGGLGAPGVWLGFFAALVASAALLSARFAARTALKGAVPAL